MRNTSPDTTANLLKPVASAYGDRLRRYGPGPAGVFWRNAEGQRLRFEVLWGIVDIDATAVTVNDFGCGYGAMVPFIREQAAFMGGRYYGYDISEAMLTAAKNRINDPRASFIHASKATIEADYSFASGTYNLKLNSADDVWLAYIQANLAQLWSKTRRGLAFNMLSAHRRDKDRDLYYAEPGLFVDFCLKSLSRNVVLLHDYPLEEWTLWVRR